MFKYASAVKPQIVISSLPTALLVGYFLKKKYGIRLIYYPLELYGEQTSPYSRLLKLAERWILRNGVDALVTQNNHRARVYEEERGYRGRSIIVHNYKPKTSVSPKGKLRRKLNLSEDVRIVLYEGLLTRGRRLANLVSTAQYLPENVKLVLIGKIDNKDNWWNHNILPRLEKPEIGEKIEILEWVPHEELLSYVADADAGVIIYDDEPRNNYYCEPGKLSDYIFTMVPVAAPNFPTIGPVIKEYRIGTTFDDFEPRTIAGAISEILKKPRSSWENALTLASEALNWSTQEPQFLEAVFGGSDRDSSADYRYHLSNLNTNS
jgi:glycosyltransferase involved in cell wall biosynthesis